MVGIISWIISAIFTIIVAYLVLCMLSTSQPSLNLALFFFNWIFFTTLYLSGMGLMGLLAPIPIALTSTAGSIAIISIPSTRGELGTISVWLRQYRELFITWWGNLPRWLRAATVIFISYSIARFAFLIWALPPFIWDSLTYHLTNVAQWIQDMRIHTFTTPVERIYNAANHEVFSTWFALFIHHDGIIEAAGLPAYLIAGLSVYAIARQLGIGQGSSWIATLAYLSTPGLTLAVTGTKNDPIMTALYLLSIAVSLGFSSPKDGKSHQKKWIPFIILMMLMLYAAGTKAYIAHLFPGILLVAWLFAIYRLGWRKTRAMIKDIFQVLSQESIGVLFVVGLLLASAFFLGSYWYIRNWVQMGNPFFPYSVQVGQSELIASDIGGFKFGLQNLYDTFQLFLQRFGDKLYLVRPDLPYTTGWGWVAYGMGLPAAIWGLIRKSSYRILFAGFLLSFIFLLFSSPTSPWNMRYFIWFPACLAIAIGFVFDQGFQHVRWIGLALSTLFSTLTALNLIMVVTYNTFRIQDIQAMLSLPFYERDSAAFSVVTPKAYQNFIENVPREALLGYNVTGNGFVYPLYRGDYSQRIVYIPIDKDDRCEDIIESMQAKGTRYLFTAPVHTLDAVRDKLFQCSQTGSKLRELGVDLYVISK